MAGLGPRMEDWGRREQKMVVAMGKMATTEEREWREVMVKVQRSEGDGEGGGIAEPEGLEGVEVVAAIRSGEER